MTKPVLLPLNAQPLPPGSIDWSYLGANGPDAWASLSPDFSVCGSGLMQSPIDLAVAQLGPVPQMQMHYETTRVIVTNTGRAVQASFSPGNWIQIGGSIYRLKEFHYHHPSEHVVDAERSPIEVHLVHQNDAGKYAIIAVLFDRGDAQNEAFRRVLAVDPDRFDTEPVTHFDPSDLLPMNRDYLVYNGSLTTPPCTEGVKYIVFANRGIVSPQQISRLNDLVPPNSRPVQFLREGVAVTSGRVSRE